MKARVLRLQGALCYTGLLSFMFMGSKSRFVRFHAKQGRALFITAILSLLVPIIGWILVCPFVFISSVTGASRAWDLQKWKVPILKRFIKYEKDDNYCFFYIFFYCLLSPAGLFKLS